MKDIIALVKEITIQEHQKLTRLNALKEEKKVLEKELMEIEDYDDIPDSYQDFDDFDFHTSAKDAAKDDINKHGKLGKFTDIGDNEIEKKAKINSKDFTNKVKNANLDLPNDKKENDKIQKGLDFEKKFGKINVNEEELNPERFGILIRRSMSSN